MKLRKLMIISAIVILVTAGIVLNSPRFLLYSTDHKKADAVIILLGPDFKARKKEANDLISKGMADYLIIPAYNKTYGIYNKGKEQYLLPSLNMAEADKKNALSFPSFYEDTHIEIIKAQKIMSLYGLKSAIFVSSPYHMRRIKMIAGKVFESGHHHFYFVPTRYEKAPVKIGELSSADWKKVRREYGKIIWFFIYYAWSESIGFN